MGLNLEEDSGFLVCFGAVGEDGDIAVWMEAVNDWSACGNASTQAFVADRHTAIRSDFQGSARAPDIRPPWATGHGAQDGAILPASFNCGGIRSATQFAMDFLGVTMTAQCGQELVGGFWGGDVFSGKQGGEPTLPVLMLAFDFAFGLRGAGVAEGDAVEVQGSTKLGQRFGPLGEEKAVAIDIEFQWHAMFNESGGKEVKVGEQVFSVVNFGAGADAGAVIQ